MVAPRLKVLHKWGNSWKVNRLTSRAESLFFLHVFPFWSVLLNSQRICPRAANSFLWSWFFSGRILVFQRSHQNVTKVVSQTKKVEKKNEVYQHTKITTKTNNKKRKKKKIEMGTTCTSFWLQKLNCLLHFRFFHCIYLLNMYLKILDGIML